MKKQSKKSLFTVIVSLVLCVCMAVGTTFAWFTDSVTSGTNRIIAGNLDIDLVMDKEEKGTYVSIAEENGAIFGGENSLIAQNKSSDTLWEPGKTQIVYLGVQNKGTLAVKYNILLTITDGGLASALEYAIIDGAKAADLTSVTDWETLKSATTQKGDVTAGTLNAAEGGVLDEIVRGAKDETDYFALAVHMKEDAGNDYMKKDVTIDVLITASQYTAERDSFDDQYDKQETFSPYLTFSSEDDFTLGVASFSFMSITTYFLGTDKLEYSTDGSNWNTFTETTVADAVRKDGTYYVYLRGTGIKTLAGTQLSLTPKNGKLIDCSGNIMTLLDYDSPDKVTMESEAFKDLFKGCTYLRTAPSLPAETLAESCYYSMFEGCTSLKTAPQIQAKTLAEYCCSYMFSQCTALETVMPLKAETLAKACYSYMFSGCTSLKTAPQIQAKTLAEDCCAGMFSECTALETVPEMSAEKLAERCCFKMFEKCTALKTAPSLPAMTLAPSCYQEMFTGCTGLTVPPILPANKLAYRCYFSMFKDCTALKTASALPAEQLAESCYQCMFENCTALETAPELPAKTLDIGCYSSMFNKCTSLTEAPNLPAETLVEDCYYSMFSGCSALKISEGSGGKEIFNYSSENTLAVNNMFNNTGGTFKNNPTVGKKYYCNK